MLLTLNATAPWSAALPHALSYRGPERREGSALMLRLMSQMLDEIDYGVLLLDGDHQVLHANHAARAELATGHPLQILGGELLARAPKDTLPLHEALNHAARRGLRRLLTLGEGAHRAGVSVVPLAGACASRGGATLVLLGKRQVCGALSVQGYAREYRLSPIEAQVLCGLCEGDSPQEIADRHGVKIATVRTQIANIRAKTGAANIRDLVQRVAQLPPLVGALRHDLVPDWMPWGGCQPLAA